jgi:hypothetical protein
VLVVAYQWYPEPHEISSRLGPVLYPVNPSLGRGPIEHSAGPLLFVNCTLLIYGIVKCSRKAYYL